MRSKWPTGWGGGWGLISKSWLYSQPPAGSCLRLGNSFDSRPQMGPWELTWLGLRLGLQHRPGSPGIWVWTSSQYISTGLHWSRKAGTFTLWLPLWGLWPPRRSQQHWKHRCFGDRTECLSMWRGWLPYNREWLVLRAAWQIGHAYRLISAHSRTKGSDLNLLPAMAPVFID